ncbi:MAG TPA: DUF5678 domain-containing protein [Dehalococcoidia bacterium]|nr:DUF5678 domain-containing protein [Dehalococcoidia bacterium]
MKATIERNVDPGEALAVAGRSIADYQRDFEHVAKHVEKLTKSYPDEWVAVIDTKVVAHHRQRRGLGMQLERSSLTDRSPVVQFLTTKPESLIF